jgi:hypothetical protein
MTTDAEDLRVLLEGVLLFLITIAVAIAVVRPR